MPPRSPAPSFDRVREALAARVEATSLRRVAGEAGMSASGLRKVLEGADSYARTRRKLERWYVREVATRRGSVEARAAESAVRVLVQDLPFERRAPAFERILTALDEIHAAAERPAPAWLAELRRSLIS